MPEIVSDMNLSLWFVLCCLMGVNAGVWLAFFRFGRRPRSQLVIWTYYVIAMAVFLVLAALIGDGRPAGPARGSAGIPATALFLAAWLGAYLAMKRLLLRD